MIKKNNKKKIKDKKIKDKKIILIIIKTNEFFEVFFEVIFKVVSTIGSNPRESWTHLLQTRTHLFPTSISCNYHNFNNSIAFLLSNNWY
jgi:hypothetical protein